MLLVSGLAGLAGCGSSESAAERDARNRQEQCESLTGANLIVREFVKDRLTAPRTAKFASYSQSRVFQAGGQCEFAVASYVDAQNAFGAEVRNHYTAKVKYVPDADRWQLLELDMN